MAYDSDPRRAIVIPLWPGNSHWSSFYQHYASLYRLRLVNGYKPAVPTSYVEDVFHRFESLNQGQVSDEQLDALVERGIDHLLLHEDAFPEKVSPFPVGVTLKRMLLHPRLSLLQQDERVWAFRILPQADEAAIHETDWNVYFPARYWEAERVPSQGAPATEDSLASGGAYISISASSNETRFALRAPISEFPGLRYRLRARGEGTLRFVLSTDGETTREISTFNLSQGDWQWIDVPVPPGAPFFTPELGLGMEAGHADIDLCVLAAGDWNLPPPGHALHIPPSCFFHAGYTDRSRNAVILSRTSEPDRVVFYAPVLPLEPGYYAIELNAIPLAGGSKRFGELSARSGETLHGPVVIRPGGENRLKIKTDNNLPLRLEFRYSRKIDIVIKDVILHRLANPDA